MKMFNETQIGDIAQAFVQKEILAFPTDTVYGVGAVYGNLDLLERLKHAKHRPETKPIPFMADSLETASQIAVINDTARKLADAFLPGALTLILEKKDSVDAAYTNGKDTLALRIPDKPYLLEVIREAGRPLMVTSANQSGEPTARNGQEAVRALPSIDGVVMGDVNVGMASTIVDCTREPAVVLRQGPITEEMIAGILKQA